VLGAGMERTNQWLSLLTNVGVLVGLGILIYEIDQNTLALSNETDVAIYSIASNVSLLQAESSEIAELMVRSTTAEWDDFDAVEQVRLGGYWGTILDMAELQFRLYSRKGDTVDNILFPEHLFKQNSFRGYWVSVRYLYEEDFVTYLEVKMDQKATGT
jgi:hypothetical protein